MGIFENFRLIYPVELSYLDNPPLKQFPWIKPSKLLQSMVLMNDMSRLLGGKRTILEAADVLTTFWSKYRTIYPKHQVWTQVDAGHKDVARMIPCYVHGDEGTTYKRGGVLLLSFQGAFGEGSRKRSEEVAGRTRGEGAPPIPLNFIRTGLQTRLLSIVCPKDCIPCAIEIYIYIACRPEVEVYTIVHRLCQDLYSEDRRVWNILHEEMAKDLQLLETEGIQLGPERGGGRFYPIILGSKGDWSYLAPQLSSLHGCVSEVESGNLERSYRRAPKGAGESTDHGVKGAGICHLCMAGTGLDWEDLRLAIPSRIPVASVYPYTHFVLQTFALFNSISSPAEGSSRVSHAGCL